MFVSNRYLCCILLKIIQRGLWLHDSINISCCHWCDCVTRCDKMQYKTLLKTDYRVHSCHITFSTNIIFNHPLTQKFSNILGHCSSYGHIIDPAPFIFMYKWNVDSLLIYIYCLIVNTMLYNLLYYYNNIQHDNNYNCYVIQYYNNRN